MDNTTKTGIHAAKTVSKRVVSQKTTEATGDLIGNKIAEYITSLGKTKCKEKKEKKKRKGNKSTYSRKKTANYP